MIDGSKYENREFDWGNKDCFELVRDVYLNEFGIYIRNYARPTNWQSDVRDLILDAYEHEGFFKVANWQLSDLRPADVMAMAIGEGNPNHMAVYCGDNKFVHHLYGNLSRVSPMAGHWVHSTCFLLRHPDVPDLRPKKADVPIQELLRGRHRNQISTSS